MFFVIVFINCNYYVILLGDLMVRCVGFEMLYVFVQLLDNYDGIYSVKIIFVEFGRYIFNILFGGEYVLGIEKIWVIVKLI